MGSVKGKGKEGARQRVPRTGSLFDDSAHKRYHRAQADEHWDTAAKRLARGAGLAFVVCPCGDRFPSHVLP